MGDILRRSIAPITEEAWKTIEEETVDFFKSYLTARKVVDFDGPHGWEYAAVNLGSLDIPSKQSGDIHWGTRMVLPLIEVRVPFTLSQMELDCIERGYESPDLDPLLEAAKKIADYEEKAIFYGNKDANIQGMLSSSEQKSVKLPEQGEEYPHAIVEAFENMRKEGIGGPYTLIFGVDAYHTLRKCGCAGYPPYRIVEDMVDGNVLISDNVKGAALISTRGGDFKLTVGQDLSIGYTSHDRDKIELYLTESFAFKINDPAAVVELK